MRHLIFFKELIDENLQYMYFDFTNAQNFPEILYQLPFDELLIEGSYKLVGYLYDTGEKKPTEKDVTLLLSHSDREDFQAPLNFYRLLLNKPNEKYRTIDLKQNQELVTSSLSNGLYYYDDQKILNCKEK